MKLFMTLLTVLGISMATVQAQNNWCGTDQYHEELLRTNPELRTLTEKKQDRLFANARLIQGAKSGDLITIPVVVHIFHDNGTGNISDEQVRDGIRVLNEDFQRINQDTNLTRSIFKAFAANVGLKFKLAGIDPNGNCTNGIVRVNTPLTHDARDNVKPLSRWPSSKYLNVWLVSSIQSFSTTGTTLGFAQFPFFGIDGTYGMVVRSDQWGAIGTSNADGRTATHEAGHLFGLFHTFQSGCGGHCSFSGDEICDTPPTFDNTFGCVPTQNTCGNDASGPSPYASDVEDQVENYMSYDACQNMFTLGQADVMLSVFTNIPELSNLVSPSNLLATGTDSSFTPQSCAPIAEFIYPNQIVCQNMTVTYTDISYNGPIGGRNWNFPGGTPATSSDSIVVVTYGSPGTYNATLTVNNLMGSDSKTYNSVVDVRSSAPDFSSWYYAEGLEDEKFNDYWRVVNNGGSRQWEITSDASYTGNNALYINNFTGNTRGQVDEFVSPSYDLSAVVQPELYFKLAYKRRISSNEDELKVFYSVDCGQTWFPRYSRSGERLETAPASNTASFFPESPDEWTEVNITLPSSVKSGSNVIFRFEFTFDGGNNIFIDDINIRNPSGIRELGANSASLSIYPNPTGDNASLTVTAKEDLENVTILITDTRGRIVREIQQGNNFRQGTTHKVQLPASELANGLYFVQVVSDKGRLVEKLIVN